MSRSVGKNVQRKATFLPVGDQKIGGNRRPREIIAHAGLRQAISDYLRRERREVERMSEYLEEHGPFKKVSGE